MTKRLRTWLMTAKDNSLQRVKIEFQYQEDDDAYRILINRIREKKRLRTLKNKEKQNVVDVSKKTK